MRKKVSLALALSLVLLAGFFGTMHVRREPSYLGRSLSCWLSDLYQSNLVFPEQPVTKGTRERAEDAIRHMGTNTLPFLVGMLRAKDSQFTKKLAAFANKQHLIHVSLLRKRERHLSAAFALHALGPMAKPAEPALIELMSYGEQDVQVFSRMLLVQIDPEYIAGLDGVAKAVSE